MNNNNSRPSINYSAVPSEAPDSTNDAPLSETTTQIHIDTIPNSAQQQQPRNEENPETVNSTSIDMEYPSNDETNDVVGATPPVHRNILTLFSEARSQFGRQTSTSLSHPHQRQEHVHEHFERGADNEGQMANSTRPISFNQSENTSQHSPHSPTTHSRNIRSWRMNLNNVLSFSSASSTEAIRSLITSSGSFRYAPLNTNESGDNIHVLLNQDPPQPSRPPTIDESLDNTFANSSSSRVSRSNSLRNENNPTLIQNIGPSRESIDVNRGGNASHDVNNSVFSAMVNGGDTSVNVQQDNNPAPAAFFSNRNQNTTNRNASQEDDENNVISDIFVKVLSHFVRYLPFICILFVKFVHDHLLGILDLVLLHGIMYQVNKSLREQVAKFSQKKYGILFRDFGLVLFVVSYRFLLASSSPDPFGLMISPPSEGVTLELTDAAISNESKKKLTVVLSKYLGNNNPENDQQSTTLENTVTITKAISLGVLLYYVAVNDLILKLITILIKISITLMPTKIIRHKPRARMFVLVEYTSQFYRALAPVRQWLMFLFESYSGLEVISGILFSSFYMGAKGFEFVERGKSFRKALINFLRNMDYERKPTRDELDAAGSLCPICHDAYTTPVVLECGHIFCDDCVSTWFKREQTCPMCRAKVSEDPTWQDGSTSFFYQLC